MNANVTLSVVICCLIVFYEIFVGVCCYSLDRVCIHLCGHIVRESIYCVYDTVSYVIFCEVVVYSWYMQFMSCTGVMAVVFIIGLVFEVIKVCWQLFVDKLIV